MNATVTGMTVVPAPAPPEPVKPVAPPGFENLTTSSGEPIYSNIEAPTAAPLLVDVDSNDTQLVFVIPTGAAVSNEPPSVVRLTSYYCSGARADVVSCCCSLVILYSCQSLW